MTWVGSASSQVFCVAILLAPLSLLQPRRPHDLYGSGASTRKCARACVRVHKSEREKERESVGMPMTGYILCCSNIQLHLHLKVVLRL